MSRIVIAGLALVLLAGCSSTAITRDGNSVRARTTASAMRSIEVVVKATERAILEACNVDQAPGQGDPDPSGDQGNLSPRSLAPGDIAMAINALESAQEGGWLPWHVYTVTRECE